MKSKRLAAIDIGTNTFRLLIAEITPAPENNFNIKELRSERIITRLGEGVSESGLIKKEAINRGVAVLKKFSEIISYHHVYRTSAVATSALREAKNRVEFLKKAKKGTRLNIKIISGEEEARITSIGMLIGIKPSKTVLMVDIGGGSTELIFIRQGKPILTESINLGVVYLADRYMKNDPPRKEDINQMNEEISQEITPVIEPFKRLFSENAVFIGTAGTVTTLAAMAQALTRFEHSKIHNYKITIEKVRSIFSNLSTITAKERIKYHPFEPERLDIIVPGTLILLKLMEIFGFKEIVVSNYGLREGLLIELYEKNIQKT